MSTIKFDLQEDLEALRARIYLDTRKKISKKELLELIFQIGKRNYNDIVKAVQAGDHPLTRQTIDMILDLVEDFGEDTEDLSQRIDEVCYGKVREENK